jgi:hypothetical protein
MAATASYYRFDTDFDSDPDPDFFRNIFLTIAKKLQFKTKHLDITIVRV